MPTTEAHKPGGTEAREAVTGHEGLLTTAAQLPALEPVGFVRPSDLLRLPRDQSRSMQPLTAIDREQLEGLVRNFLA